MLTLTLTLVAARQEASSGGADKAHEPSAAAPAAGLMLTLTLTLVAARQEASSGGADKAHEPSAAAPAAGPTRS